MPRETDPAPQPAPEAADERMGEPKASDAESSAAVSVDEAVQSATTDRGDTRPEADELEQLRKELAEVQERADRYHANWQRSAADFQNWKRRADQEKADAVRIGEAGLMTELLRVLDDFERAFQALPADLRRLTWLEGVAMIWQKTFTILQSHGLSPIEAEGKDFDPYLHEAVMREEDGDPTEQTAVVAELQRGYRLHERVIRPTLVKVGKPRPAGETNEAEGGAE